MASAATIVPTSVTASSQYPGYEVGFAIDQGGNSANTDFASQSQLPAFINLNLGSSYSISGVDVTDRVTSGGPNGTFFGGTTDFTTSFSLQVFTTAAFTTAFGAPVVFNKTPPVNPTSPADFNFTSATSGLVGQFIRYTALSSTSGTNVGISNITFQGVSATPEPATWGMLLLGFGVAGSAMRRRKLAPVAA